MSSKYLLWLVEDVNDMHKEKLLLQLNILKEQCSKYKKYDVYFKYMRYWDSGYLLINVIYFDKNSDPENDKLIKKHEFYLLSVSLNKFRKIDELYAIKIDTSEAKIITLTEKKECKICVDNKLTFFSPGCHEEHNICSDCYLKLEYCPYCNIQYNNLKPSFNYDYFD